MHQQAQAIPLCANHQHERAREVYLVDRFAALSGQTVDPKASSLQGFQGLNQVAHPRNVQVLDRAGRHLHHRGSYAHGPPLGNDDTLCAQGFGTAGDRPQIVRIRHPIHCYQHGAIGGRLGLFNHIRQVQVIVGRRLGCHTLVIAPIRQPRQLAVGGFIDDCAVGLSRLQQPHKPGIVAQLGHDPEFVQGALAL